MTQIAPPETLADVPRWLTQWAELLEENGKVAGAVLAELANSLTPPAPLDAEPWKPWYEPAPGTLVENADFRCAAVKSFDDRFVQVAGVFNADGSPTYRVEPGEPVRCNVSPDPHELHTGFKQDGTACYWADEVTESHVIPEVAAWNDIALPPAGPALVPVTGLYPVGEACGRRGPDRLLCVMLTGHTGPCWSPTDRGTRVAWTFDDMGRPAPVERT